MAEIGYTLSSEEHAPVELVRNARRAEEAGFAFALISDHFHPWIDRQGQSPFVWGVIGAIAQATDRMRLGTGVTCPIGRIHPAIVAQAAATAAALMPGRFFLGVGTGENLNEHVTGARWPAADERLSMLEEAIAIMRRLWEGEEVTHRGDHFVVEHARVYSLPESPPPIMVAVSGPRAAEVAARAGDGMIGTSPKAELLELFRAEGGKGRPTYGKVTACWAATEADARRTAREWWPNTALQGELGQELPLPRHFEQATVTVTEDQVAESVVCGPDAERHVAAIGEFIDAGYDHVFVHQIGPDQNGFIAFYEDQILPKLR
jgi:coenzyme F420-dependent glucose-6-phosphate dehydrogenase